MNLTEAFQTLMQLFPGCEIRITPKPPYEDDYRRIESIGDGQAKVFFRYYGEWVHADTMGYAAAVALQPEWYSYQRREYMLSRT